MDPLLFNLLAIVLTSSVIGAIITGIFKLRENRTTLRYGYDIQQAQRESRWNALYRAAAEAHLKYDLQRDQNIYQLQALVNHLLTRLGEPAREFPPMDPAPPLFPLLDEAPNARA